MKLYFSPGACSLSVRILLNELSLQADYEAVDLKTKKTSVGDDYLKINPKGAVPVLITDDNETLTENSAIHQYLASLAKATQMLPSENDFNRFRVLEWLGFINSEVHKGFGPLFNSAVPVNLKDELFKPILKKKFDYIEKEMEGKNYLVNDSFTLPDVYLFVMILWLYRLTFDMTSWPNLAAYFSRIKQRPSVKKSLLEEGLQ